MSGLHKSTTLEILHTDCSCSNFASQLEKTKTVSHSAMVNRWDFYTSQGALLRPMPMSVHACCPVLKNCSSLLPSLTHFQLQSWRQPPGTATASCPALVQADTCHRCTWWHFPPTDEPFPLAILATDLSPPWLADQLVEELRQANFAALQCLDTTRQPEEVFKLLSIPLCSLLCKFIRCSAAVRATFCSL